MTYDQVLVVLCW